MTYPSNLKPRELYCPRCKTYIMNDIPNPTCQECFGYLITVIYNLEGERMTGNDELANRISNATQRT